MLLCWKVEFCTFFLCCIYLPQRTSWRRGYSSSYVFTVTSEFKEGWNIQQDGKQNQYISYRNNTKKSGHYKIPQKVIDKLIISTWPVPFLCCDGRNIKVHFMLLLLCHVIEAGRSSPLFFGIPSRSYCLIIPVCMKFHVSWEVFSSTNLCSDSWKSVACLHGGFQQQPCCLSDVEQAAACRLQWELGSCRRFGTSRDREPLTAFASILCSLSHLSCCSLATEEAVHSHTALPSLLLCHGYRWWLWSLLLKIVI